MASDICVVLLKRDGHGNVDSATTETACNEFIVIETVTPGKRNFTAVFSVDLHGKAVGAFVKKGDRLTGDLKRIGGTAGNRTLILHVDLVDAFGVAMVGEALAIDLDVK
jgi:hypothetical protein